MKFKKIIGIVILTIIIWIANSVSPVFPGILLTAECDSSCNFYLPLNPVIIVVQPILSLDPVTCYKGITVYRNLNNYRPPYQPPYRPQPNPPPVQRPAPNPVPVPKPPEKPFVFSRISILNDYQGISMINCPSPVKFQVENDSSKDASFSIEPITLDQLKQQIQTEQEKELGQVKENIYTVNRFVAEFDAKLLKASNKERIKIFQELLKSKDSYKRYYAVKRFAELGAMKKILNEVLIEENSLMVQSAIASVLSRLGNKSAKLLLIKKIMETEIDDFTFWDAAFISLKEMEETNFSKIIVELIDTDKNKIIYKYAVRILKEMKESNALVKLLNKGDSAADIDIIKALSVIGDRGAVSSLLKTLDYSNDVKVREEALRALVNMDVTAALIKVLDNKEEASQLREYAAEKAGLSNSAIPVLCRVLKNDENEVLRKIAANSLLKLKAINSLIEFLGSKDQKLVDIVVDVLGTSGDKSIVPKVKVLLARNNEKIRFYAVDILARIGDNSVVPELIKRLANDNDKDVRWAAATALGLLQDKKTFLNESVKDRQWAFSTARSLSQDKAVLDVLKSAFENDEDEGVRLASEKAIAKIPVKVDSGVYIEVIKVLSSEKDKDAVSLLLNIFDRSDDLKVRKEAFRVLINLDVTSVLIKVLDNKEEAAELREYAAEKALFYKSAVPALCRVVKNDENEVLRKIAANSLLKLKAADSLIEFLESKDNKLIEIVADTLGNSKDKSIVPKIKKFLTDSDDKVRFYIVDILARIGDASVVPELTEVLANDSSKDVRWAAATALGLFKNAKVISILKYSSENDTDEEVRRASEKALSKIYGKKEQ